MPSGPLTTTVPPEMVAFPLESSPSPSELMTREPPVTTTEKSPTSSPPPPPPPVWSVLAVVAPEAFTPSSLETSRVMDRATGIVTVPRT